MTAQALAGAFAGITVVVLGLYTVLWHRWRRDVAELRGLADRAMSERDRVRRELNDRMAQGEAAAVRAETRLSTERMLREHAEAKIEELQLELARRRLGPLQEGELVAVTTPQDRTVRGVVRQTFDNGALLLGAAVIYGERVGRGGVPEAFEQPAGDVVVPAHEWAQKLPPAPVEE